MTTTNEPTTPRQYQPGGPVLTPGEQVLPLAPAKRGPLRTTRDVLACIYYLLASIIMIALLVFGGTVLNALGDAGSSIPDPASTECIGEVPC